MELSKFEFILTSLHTSGCVEPGQARLIDSLNGCRVPAKRQRVHCSKVQSSGACRALDAPGYRAERGSTWLAFQRLNQQFAICSAGSPRVVCKCQTASWNHFSKSKIQQLPPQPWQFLPLRSACQAGSAMLSYAMIISLAKGTEKLYWVGSRKSQSPMPTPTHTPTSLPTSICSLSWTSSSAPAGSSRN